MDKKLDLGRFWGFSGRGLIFLLKTTFFLGERLDLGRFWDFSGRDPIFPLKTTFFLDKKLDPGKIKQNQAKPGKMKQNQGKTSKIKQKEVPRGGTLAARNLACLAFFVWPFLWWITFFRLEQNQAKWSKMKQNQAKSSKTKQNQGKTSKNNQHEVRQGGGPLCLGI